MHGFLGEGSVSEGVFLSYSTDKGEMTAAQKGLMIIAIVYLMAGVLLLLSSLSLLDPSSRSGAAGQQAPVLTLLGLSPGADTGARQPSVAQASQVTPAFVLCLDLGLFTLLAGICGIRAATDVERIVPYLLLSCALFLYKAAITVAALFKGTFVLSAPDLAVLILTAVAVLLGISVSRQREKPSPPDSHPPEL